MLGSATAAGPVGTWLVEEKTAEIRIIDCATTLWGVISWEKVSGRDEYNSDPALRNRPLLGSAILIGMKPDAARKEWSGKVYNAQDGKQYDAKIRVTPTDTLELTGCLMGFLCKTVPWTRVAEAPSPTAAQAKAPARAAKGAPKAVDFAKDPDAELCPIVR